MYRMISVLHYININITEIYLNSSTFVKCITLHLNLLEANVIDILNLDTLMMMPL